MSKSRVLPTLSSSSRETAVKKISIWSFFACNKYPPQFTNDKSNDSSISEGIHWMRLIDLEGDTNFTLQNQSAVKGKKLWFVCSTSFFSLPAACRLFSRGMIFTLVHVSLALLSLRKSGGLLVAYFEKDISAEKMSSSNEEKFDELLRRRIVRQPRNFAERRLLVQVITRFRVQFGINKHK